MSLRLKINLIVLALSALFMATLVWQEVDATRRSVQEEMVASNRVTTQLLRRLSAIYEQAGARAVQLFLSELGRVRANDLTLLNAEGTVLYRSPPSTYKQGREAPAWFARLMNLQPERQQIAFGNAQLIVESDPSRAVLDGWDDIVALVGGGSAAALVLGGLALLLVHRAVRPFPTILDGLERLERGDLGARLPPLAGREARTIGDAVNRMARAVEDHVQVRVRALEAERRLAQSHEVARLVAQHTEAERRAIARELHDELGQSVTAIRSLATALGQRLAGHDPEGASTATLIAQESGRLYDAMHGMIPRLTPMTLDSLGLVDTLVDLVRQTSEREAAVDITFEPQELLPSLDPEIALAAYRVVQEALTNALRHGRASRIAVGVQVGVGEVLDVRVEDDGSGIPADWPSRGRFGLRGLAERVESLGGRFEATRREPHGTRVRATIPLAMDNAAAPT